MTHYMYIGTASNKKLEQVKKGDILQLVTGEKCTFLDMSRTRFSANINGKSYKVPVFRDKSGTTPFVTAIIGFDESVTASEVSHTDLKRGDLFSIDGHKEAFMFQEIRGANVIGLNIADQKPTRIRIGHFTLSKIDLDELRKA